MKRRRLLQCSATIMAGISAGVAGCTGVTGGADPEQAREHISTARDELLRNGETFDNFAQQRERGETLSNFDAGTIENRVERANEALDQAEEVATDEQQPIIEALRQWGAFQEKRALYSEKRLY